MVIQFLKFNYCNRADSANEYAKAHSSNSFTLAMIWLVNPCLLVTIYNQFGLPLNVKTLPVHPGKG